VDYKRVNEFGQGGEGEDEVENESQEAFEDSLPAKTTRQVTAQASGSDSSNTSAHKRN